MIQLFQDSQLVKILENPYFKKYIYPKGGLEFNGKLHIFNVKFDRVHEFVPKDKNLVINTLRKIDKVFGFKGNKTTTFQMDR